jgi:hypothetical protein
MKIQFFKSLAIIALSTSLFSSCKKTDTLEIPFGGTEIPQVKNLTIMLTGGAANIQKVFIDVQKIEVKAANVSTSMTLSDILTNDVDSDDAQNQADEFGIWETTNFQPQTVDVTSLKNGLDYMLSSVSLPSRALKVRLTIGEGSYIIDSLGNEIELKLSDSNDNLVYLTLTDDVLDIEDPRGDAVVNLHFDVANSIIDNNGVFTLKPQIRAFSNGSFGEIIGSINQIGVHAKISLTDVTGFSTTTVSEEDGTFRFRGIKPGSSFSVKVEANGFQESIINDISVEKARATNLGLIIIQ